MLYQPADLVEYVRDNLAFGLITYVCINCLDELNRCQFEQCDMIKQDTPQVAPIRRINISEILSKEVE